MRFEYLLAMPVVLCASPMWVVSPISELDTRITVSTREYSIKRIRLVDAAGITIVINAAPIVGLVWPFGRNHL